MKLIDGKKISDQIKIEIATEVKEIIANGGKTPHLAAILVGHDGGSVTYVSHKVADCKEVGFTSSLFHYEDDITEEFLLAKVAEINQDPDIDGLIVQLPLPKHINAEKIIEAINPIKDVDGFHPANVGRMSVGLPTLLPATPSGVIELIRRYDIPSFGKHCVVVGRSNIVGSPLSILLSKNWDPGNCTVTLCHRNTQNLSKYTIQADILIVAVGIPGLITADMVKEGAVVIDVGTTRVKSDVTKSGYKLKGDVDFEMVAPKCSYITPVPGGVGPLTRMMLLKNTLKAAKKEYYS